MLPGTLVQVGAAALEKGTLLLDRFIPSWMAAGASGWTDGAVRGSSSSGETDWVVLVFVIIIAVPLIGLMVWLRKKKVREYRAWAAQNGFHYEPRDDTVAELSTGEPFQEGSSRMGMDVFRGQYRGMHVMFFHYQYTTGFGKDRESHPFQVAAIGLPAPRPRLDIGHEGWWSRRFTADIDFENQAFNNHYKINCDSRRFAFDIIHPRTMEWMLSDPRALHNEWRFEGQWLLTWRAGGLNFEDVFLYLDFLIDIYSQVPRFVWANQ
ncbi:hypothetical protein [Haloglycomyces albus]|uniref:hypothetical protein n=1 Tax=Haloglycomyces albus TaxID=526067 RepID=UPI00046D7F06|nr:hypothetical protein [Haloglycomyces albus]